MISVIDGTNTRSAATAMAIKMKGSTELMTSPIVVPAGATPLATKSSNPNGGVARLISNIINAKTPNQI